jgi:hypothetical protein
MMFIFNLNVVFYNELFNGTNPCALCTLAQDSSQEQFFPESNLLQRGSRTPEELLRFGEAALTWFSFLWEHIKFCKKVLSEKSCSKESEVRLL